jgi:hypothetical protein
MQFYKKEVFCFSTKINGIRAPCDRVPDNPSSQDQMCLEGSLCNLCIQRPSYFDMPLSPLLRPSYRSPLKSPVSERAFLTQTGAQNFFRLGLCVCVCLMVEKGPVRNLLFSIQSSGLGSFIAFILLGTWGPWVKICWLGTACVYSFWLVSLPKEFLWLGN